MAMLMSVMSFAAEATATISFANKAQRTVYTTSQQVWEQNGIVVTNDKASSTTNVGDYANPARFYKGSKVTIQCTLGNIKQIEITGWGDSKYNVWATSIGSEAAASGSSVIITPTAVSDTYVANMTGGQARAGQMVVTYEVSDEGFVATPAIEGEPYFKESATVSMKAAEGLKVYYTLDGTDPTTASAEYAAPFEVTETTTVKAIAHDGENASDVVTVVFKKMEVLTPSEAAAITPTGDKYIVRGYVTSSNEYSTQYNNIDFFVADTKDGGEVLKVYRAVAVTEEDKAVKVGDYVEVIGVLAAYYETIQIAQGGTYTIIPEPEPEYMVVEDKINNFVFDMEAWPMVCTGGPSTDYGVEVYLVLTEDADGTLDYDQCSVSIQGQDATFIDGTLANIDPSAPYADAVLHVQWGEEYYELHLAMSGAVAEPYVVEVENATVEVTEYETGFDGATAHELKVTADWVNEAEELTYAVEVLVTDFDPTAAVADYSASLFVTGEGDAFGMAEGIKVTVAVDGNKLTVSGEGVKTFNGNVYNLSLSGKLPVEEPAGVTYNVTVPEGTYACYIAGEMNEWTHQEMNKVDDTHYTITIEGATTEMKYKYCSGPEWGYVEKDANGNEVLDRTYAENDVVASWAAIYNPNPTVEPETKDITVKAKVPAAWTDQITAWVWYTGEAGKEVVPTQEGDWYVVTETCDKLNIIFKNGAGWNGDANQTVDMTFAESTCVEITAGEGKATFTAVDCESDIEPETTWTVAGSSAAVFGTAWDPANVANDMTLQNDGTYKWEKKELLFAAGDPIQFKVVKNHAWTEAYPSADYELTIPESGIYTLTITFNPSTKEVVAVATKTGDAEVEVEISYVLMGVQDDWETGIALTQNPENANEYILLGQEILEGDAVKVVTLRNGVKSIYCGNVDETSPVAYGFGADGNIVLKPGKYDFYYKVAENIIYIGGEAYPEVIAYELDGGVLPAPAVPTQEELWASFKTAAGLTTLGTLVEITEAGAGKPHNNPDNPCACRIICAKLLDANVNAVFALPEWAWLKAYIMTVQSGLPEASNVSWRYAFAAFFLQSEHSAYPASADFTEAGKPEAWGAAYQAANELVLPTEPVAEDYVLPTPTKEGYKFVGWYDNAAGEGDAYDVIPAGWSGTLYAIWEQDTTTALENIAVEGKAVKAIINGQLIIIKNGVQYNAQGQVVK